MRNVAVFGASGAVGSMFINHLMHAKLLTAGDRVTLLGRDSEKSRRVRAALREDLLDAFHEDGIEIVTQADFVLPSCSVFVMAAGATISDDRPSRRDLARENAPLFDDVAQGLAASGSDPFVVVVSNPVELGVAAFARRVDRRKVIGMGAQQDSLRFARAVAEKLGTSRADVDATVLGQHGEHMVPIWSSVRLKGGAMGKEAELQALRRRYDHEQTEPVGRLLEQANRLMDRSGAEKAFKRLDEGSPETRILVEPTMATIILHATANATANATLQVVRAILDPDDTTIRGQVVLEGELLGLSGVCGAPLRVTADGWAISDDVRPSAHDRALLERAIEASAEDVEFLRQARPEQA